MLLKRGLSNSSDEERKQVPFSCETLIVTKRKEFNVFALVMHAISQQGAGFFTWAHSFEPLAPTSQLGVGTVPRGRALDQSACHHPAGGSGATRQEIREEVGKAGPTHILAAGSLLQVAVPAKGSEM